MTKVSYIIGLYEQKMANLQALGNGFCKFCLALTYQSNSVAFLPKSAPFLKKFFKNDNGPPALRSLFLIYTFPYKLFKS